jgi:hypothetical protein
MEADEKQAEASKNDEGVSRNRASDFNRLQRPSPRSDETIRWALSNRRSLNHITRWFILGILEQLTRQNSPV